jgi:hypothetical protein
MTSGRQVNVERIVALVEIMAEQSRFPCFVGNEKVRQLGFRDSYSLAQLYQRQLGSLPDMHAALNAQVTIIQKLRARLLPRTPMSKSETLAHALDLVTQSFHSITTRQYDNFQWYTNEVMP